MVKTKNPTQSVELRLSVNLSLDDVGLTRLYKELREIEISASGLASIEVHALKRRHLLTVLHAYCANAFEPLSQNTDVNSSKFTQKLSPVDKAISNRATPSISLPIFEILRQEHPPPAVNSEADKALVDIGLNFKSQT